MTQSALSLWLEKSRTKPKRLPPRSRLPSSSPTWIQGDRARRRGAWFPAGSGAGHIAAGVSEEARRAEEAGDQVWAAYGAAFDAGLSEANVTLIPTWYSDERDRITRGLYVVDRNRFPDAAAGMRTMTEDGVDYTWEGDVQRAFRAPRRGFLDRLKSRRR